MKFMEEKQQRMDDHIANLEERARL